MQQNTDLVQNLRSLEKRTPRQNRVIELFDKSQRTVDEDEYLDALLNAEIARSNAQVASKLAAKKAVRNDGKVRRERTRSLIEIGGLVVIAELDKHDPATLLGGLMSLRGVDESVIEQWKSVGSVELLRRQKVKKQVKPSA